MDKREKGMNVRLLFTSQCRQLVYVSCHSFVCTPYGRRHRREPATDRVFAFRLWHYEQNSVLSQDRIRWIVACTARRSSPFAQRMAGTRSAVAANFDNIRNGWIGSSAAWNFTHGLSLKWGFRRCAVKGFWLLCQWPNRARSMTFFSLQL